MDSQRILSKTPLKTPVVVYGVYDASLQPFSVRFQDFFIDRRRVKIQEKSNFFHLLGVMLDAGIPLLKALQVLAMKVENPRLGRIVNTLAYDVERGRLLSQSMIKFSDVFDSAEIGIIRSGESIGNLSGLLLKLADQTERAYLLFLKVRGALIYPATVLLALLISGAIVVRVVIPKIEQFFNQADAELPFLTELVLTVGRGLIDFGWLVLIFGVFLMLLGSFYMSTESGKRGFHLFLLQNPLTRDIIRKVNVARFVQLLSLLVEAGVPIHEALKITSGAMTNVWYQDFLEQLRLRVEQGGKIADHLAEAPFLFPDTVVAMVSVGETSGKLAQISNKLAGHYEDEVRHSLDDFTALLEPAVIVFVGIAVAVLALALLGPIFSLSTLVS